MNMKMKMMVVGLLAAFASAVFATPDWRSWNDGYARSFSSSDIVLEYHGDWFNVPILLVANEAEGGPLLARGDSRTECEIPHCPFTRDGYEFTGWKLFDACRVPGIDSGTITSCVLPSGETYEWDYGYVGVCLPGENIGKPCGVMVLVAQWRKTQETPKYRLTVSVDPNGKGGSVSGSGTYAPGTTVTLKATPKKGYYFSEWEVLGTVDASIKPWHLIKRETGMFQKPSIKVKMPRGATKIAARFVKADKDYIRMRCEFESPWYSCGKGDVDLVQISSAALLRSVRAVSLPKGVSFKKSDYFEYYFRITNAAQLSPGKKYTAKIVAVSTTGKSKTLTLSIRGPNRTTAVDKGVLKLDTYYDGDTGGYRLRAGTKFNWADLGISAAEGWKITKVTGLPGVKWDVAKQMMVGVPSKKGTYTVMFTVTKGQTSYTASATFKVSALLPSAATGTFNGFVTWTYDRRDTDDQPFDNPESYYVGTENLQLDSYSLNVKVTVSSAGKISAKVGDQSFSGTGLTFVSNGVYKATLRKSKKITSGEFKGCTQSWLCAFEIDTAAGWDAMQMKGVYWSLGYNCAPSMGAPGFFTAQRNPFGKNAKNEYLNKTAGKIATKFSKHGTMKTYSGKIGAGVYDLFGLACGEGNKTPLSFKISTAGKVTVTGKVGNLAVSGTTTLKIAPSTWEASPWSPYDTKYDEKTGEYLREYTGKLAYQADFCLTAASEDVHIHVEFNPIQMDCRHGWATVGYHTWDEYYDNGDSSSPGLKW